MVYICIYITFNLIIYNFIYMLLLLLSHFSRVQLCVTPQMVAHWLPPSLGFSRQEYWSGLPFPSPLYMYLFMCWVFIAVCNLSLDVRLRLSCLVACGNLVNSAGNKPQPCIGRQTLNHWTTFLRKSQNLF